MGGSTPGCPGGVWAGSAGWGGAHLSGQGLSDQSSQLMPHTLQGVGWWRAEDIAQAPPGVGGGVGVGQLRVAG